MTRSFFSILTLIFLQIEYIRGSHYTGINHLFLSSYYVYIIVARTKCIVTGFKALSPCSQWPQACTITFKNRFIPRVIIDTCGCVTILIKASLRSTFWYVILLLFILRNEN